MTLIITVASPLFVIQAGDRLLTTQSDGETKQFDDKSVAADRKLTQFRPLC